MKQETNNEMDLLLRRLGRRDDAAMPEDHLDADELSAYAENALPAAARARYTMHLAECSRCRNLVAQLSSSAGVVAATDSAAVPEPSGLRKFLASLFTPMVLRYAAPALGLIVVAAIGFMVLRSNQPEQHLARNADSGTQQQPVASPSDSAGIVFSYSNPTPSPGRVDEEKKEKNQAAGPAALPNTPPAVTNVEADVAKEKAVAQAKAEEQPASAANEPPPPVKSEPKPTPEQSPRAAETEAAKNEVKIQPSAAPQTQTGLRDEQREDRKKDSDKLARARKPTESVSVAAGRSTVGNIQGGGSDDRVDTRTVAGRRFRKQGGVWVDTAYDSSKDAVTLSRGSEQYRALVADEPAIKTIADQLDGEIIVVWKGHTYRIR